MSDNNQSESVSEAQDDSKPEWYHYAVGVVHRLAEEEYHQKRQANISDYWKRPTGEEVVEDMVEKGFEESEAREAVRAVWEDEYQKTKERGL